MIRRTEVKLSRILDTMLPVDSEAQAAQRQLDKILASPGFARNERMSRFLRFVVERHLEGRDQELKESLIAIEVFGRPPGYDSKQDPIVRTEASRLRARLSEYYLADGKGDSIIIDLPRGGYVPVLRQAVTESSPTQDQRLKRALPIAVAAACAVVTLIALLGGWWWFHKNVPIPIAVLPLSNLGEDSAHDYFADGLTGEIIRNLSIIDGLAVRSQTSSFAFKGKPQNVREAGKQLEADYIVEGSVQRAGQQLRITAQLIRVSDDFPLWSGRYDRELTDVLAIEDEISRGIVNSLRLKLGGGRRRYETSAEAYDLYLQARALGIQRGLDGENRSVAPFEAAIAKDPSFAPAYAGLAAAHVARSGQANFDLVDEMAKMQTAAERAIQLDPLLGEAHGAMGIVYARQAQWAQSEKSFRHALELAANDSVIYDNFAGSFLMPLGRIQEAVQLLRKAEKNDPVAPRLHSVLANALIAAGRYDAAAEQCMKLPADFPARSTLLARARLGQGRIQEAIQILVDRIEEGAAGPDIKGFLGYAYGRAGRRDEAEKLAADQRPYPQALTFAGLGDKERTLDALERMAILGPVRLGRDLTYPEFDLVRGDPRLKALRKRLGLPE
jgi:TolB-like protein/Tfp pilus assembly protein PilF